MDRSGADACLHSHCYCGTTAGQAVLAKLGLTGIPVYNTNNNCSSGSSALHLAHALVSGGQRGAVLVLGFEQMERGLTETFPNKPSPTQEQTDAIRALGIATDPLPGLNALTSDVIRIFAEAANDYCKKYGASPRIFAEIAVKNREHGVRTEYSSLRGRVPPSVDDVASQRMLYEPITGFMSAPTADGAAAAVIVSLPFLVSMHSKSASPVEACPVVELLAISMRCDGPSSLTTARGICGYDLARAATDDVFSKIGIGITIKNVDIIELHDCFATAELHLYDSLGLSPVGGAARLWASRRSRPPALPGGVSHTLLVGENGGEWVVNPSGGLESKGHPIGATGLAQCYELWLQLQGRAGLRQVLKHGNQLPTFALQHNFGFNGGAVVALYSKVTLGEVISASAYFGASGLHASSLCVANALSSPSTHQNCRVSRLSAVDKDALAAAGYSSLWSDLQTDVHVQLSSHSDLLPFDSPPHVRGIRGSLPLELKGSFIRNGPGIATAFGSVLKHPIDGDGVIVALCFDGVGGVLLTSAFVETHTRKEEQIQNRMIFKGRMGSVPPPPAGRGWRDPAHTNVIEWTRGRLLALHEYDSIILKSFSMSNTYCMYNLPWIIDAASLRTLGQETFGGALLKRKDGSGGSVCAHMRTDAISGRTVAVQLSPPGIQDTNSDGSPCWRLPCVRFFEIEPSGSVACESQHYVAGLNYVHDLSLTPSFYVVHMSPFAEVSYEGIDEIISGKRAPGESMKLSPGAPCRLLIFRRPLPCDDAQQLPPPMHFDLPAAVHIYHFSRAIEHVTNEIPGIDSETVGGVFIPQHYMGRKADDCVVSSSDVPKTYAATRCIAVEVEACVLGRGFTMNASDGLFLSNASEAPGVMARIICRMGSTAATMQQIDSCSCEFPTSHPQRSVSSVVHNDKKVSGSETSGFMSVFDRVATAPGVPSLASAVSSPQLIPPRYTYLMANDRGSALPFCDIVKLDACGTGRQVWRSEGVVGEPCFVPRPGQLMEDEGWVIVQVQRLVQCSDAPSKITGCVSATTEFAVLDARDICKGPVAVIAPGVLIPTGFHGDPSFLWFGFLCIFCGWSSVLSSMLLETLCCFDMLLRLHPFSQALLPLSCAARHIRHKDRHILFPSRSFDCSSPMIY